MRKVDVVRPPINYVVISTMGQIAWFVNADDATDFITSQGVEIAYEVAEVRR